MACDQPGCAYELGGPGSAAACGRLLKLRSRLVPARPGHSPDRAGRFAGTTCATAKAGEPGWVFPARAATWAQAAAGEPLQRPCDTLALCRARVGPQFDPAPRPLFSAAQQGLDRTRRRSPATSFHEVGMAANKGKRPGGLFDRRRVSCGKRRENRQAMGSWKGNPQERVLRSNGSGRNVLQRSGGRRGAMAAAGQGFLDALVKLIEPTVAGRISAAPGSSFGILDLSGLG